ncbi:MAG: hypothetical protein M3R04_04465, partial [bacterium]|nr:hypothetical protein [bacterium]
MKRLSTGLVLAFAAAFLFGCGGSSAPIPDNGNNGNDNGGNGSLQTVKLQPPTSISGSHSVTNKPGQVNVVAGGTAEDLAATITNLGYSILNYDNGHATIQVPEGSEAAAAVRLEKEFNILSAEPVRVINTPTFHYDTSVRSTSFYPQFPDYGEVVFAFTFDGTNVGIGNFIGQSIGYNIQKFNGAWEVTVANAAVASQPVSVAVIDAGFWDFSLSDQPGLNDVADDATVPGTVLDVLNSGFVDGAGVFTPGLTAAAWEMDTNGDPYRNHGNHMLGMLAGGSDGFVATVRGFDLSGDTIITEDEVWNEGIMGANPNANYMLIKTGSGDGTTWSFTDNEIAESIDHAVASGANIVLLGMFAPGTVSANISTAIANARAADVLVICPAGDVVASYDNVNDVFTETAVDITVTPFTPSSDPNVVSVAASGLNRIGALGQVDFGGGPINNVGTGWFPRWGGALDTVFTEVAFFSNTGATIAGVGQGMGFGPRPFLIGGAGEVLPGVNYSVTLERFGTNTAAAYVAGAASMVFQTLSEVNGIPPTDDEVLAELLTSVQLRGMTGIDDPLLPGLDDGGLLDAGLAVTSAINGGNLVTPLPAMELTTITVSQPFAAVTRGTDFSFTANIINGT